MNSQHENANSKGDFVLKKNSFKNLFYRFLVYKTKSDSDMV